MVVHWDLYWAHYWDIQSDHWMGCTTARKSGKMRGNYWEQMSGFPTDKNWGDEWDQQKEYCLDYRLEKQTVNQWEFPTAYCLGDM
jgi:hypothetical protein